MIVVKLGGSLCSSSKLKACLDKVENLQQHSAIVVVPGGGAIADQVRKMQQQWQFNDQAAHGMAILAMQQMAMLFNALKPQFKVVQKADAIRTQSKPHTATIWSPDVLELDKAGIPPSWAVTSDSLSAWLAKTLAAQELILVKSVNIDVNFDLRKLVRDQVVDASFAEYIQQAKFKLNIINAEKFLSEFRQNPI